MNENTSVTSQTRESFDFLTAAAIVALVYSQVSVKHSYKSCQISLQIRYLSWLKPEQTEPGRHQNVNLR